MKTAYVTTLCNGAGYVPGVEALGRSLDQTGTPHPKVVLHTSDVPFDARERLAEQGWWLREIEPIDNPSPSAGLLFDRFASVFTKLRAWELTEFDKVVLMDADMLVIRNIDDLFERPEFAAAPDFFLPDRFNSGLMVLDPSEDVFGRMMDALSTYPSYDGGDQGFLNTFLGNWYAMPIEHRLPAGYNLHHFIYQFLHGHPSLANALEWEAKVLHYTMQKPWTSKPTLTGGSAMWWNVYFGVHPEADSELKRRVHEMEDWSFDRMVTALVG